MQWIGQHRLFFSSPTSLLFLVPKQYNKTDYWVRGFRMWEAYQAVGIPRWSQIKSCQPDLQAFTTVPEVTGRGSQPSKKLASAAKVTEQQAKDWLKSRPSGRSICLLHDTYHSRNLKRRYQKRPIKPTCSSCHTTA